MDDRSMDSGMHGLGSSENDMEKCLSVFSSDEDVELSPTLAPSARKVPLRHRQLITTTTTAMPSNTKSTVIYKKFKFRPTVALASAKACSDTEPQCSAGKESTILSTTPMLLSSSSHPSHIPRLRPHHRSSFPSTPVPFDVCTPAQAETTTPSDDAPTDPADSNDNHEPIHKENFESASVESLPELVVNENQRIYLVTYSNAKDTLFPTRESFGQAVVQAFGSNNVNFFSVARELHANGTSFHYHVAICLKQSRRWKKAKDYLFDNHHIVVNFKESPKDGFYSRAWSYINKEDKSVFKGSVLKPHPPLEKIGGHQRAMHANAAYCRKRKEANANAVAEAATSTKQKKKEKERRIDRLDVVNYIREKGIHSEEELFAVAEERNAVGQRDLASFILKLGKKGRAETIRDAWLMAGAARAIQLKQKPRVELLQECAADEGSCVCNGVWLVLALDLLEKNNIPFREVAGKFYDAIKGGRRKDKNILIIGESNCGKTFLLEPLKEVFEKTFNKPASSMFGWVGVLDHQIIYLNDFRWINPEASKAGIITWHDFLTLLEGNDVELPAPMNAYSDMIKLTKSHDLPIFCTSLGPIRFYINTQDEPRTNVHHSEDKMMHGRWINPPIHLKHEIDEKDKVHCPPCGHCFSRFVLSGKNYVGDN